MLRLTRRQFMRSAALSLAAIPALGNRPLSSLLTLGDSAPAGRGKRGFAVLEDKVQGIFAAHHMPGMQVGLIRDNKLIYARGFGVRDIRTGAPMTEKSVMIMQSMAKGFTGAALLQLRERGKVNLSRRYLDYVPSFKMEDDARYTDITVSHLLGHRSGLPFCVEGGFFEEFMTPAYGPDASRLAVRSLKKGITLLQDPGGPDFLYSDVGYDILAELLRLEARELFEDYVQRRILTPLHMKDSTMLYPEVDPRTLVAPHIYDSTGKIIVWDHFPWDRKHTPSSGLFSNMLDFSQWVLMHLNGGAWQGQRVLQPSSQAFMWTPMSSVPPEWGWGNGYCMGWFMGTEGTREWRMTAGGGPGSNTVAVVSPREGLAAMAFSNLYDQSAYHGGYFVGELCFWALQQMLDGVF